MASREQERSLRVDEWLGSGGLVVASSERSARAVAKAFEAARRVEGRTAWETPAIFSWEAWLRDGWLARNTAGVMLLNSLQEQALWERVIGRSQMGRGLLHSTRLATAAQQAYRLLANFAPEAMRETARGGWSGDTATFSGWMAEFDTRCRKEGLLSASRLPVELAGLLAEESDRAPLLLVGFDRLTKTQRSVLEAWGAWRLDGAVSARDSQEESARYVALSDADEEIAACVGWIREKLAQNPKARLMVVTPGLRERRGELERALLDASDETGAPLDFEFSLGVPLGRLSGVRAALLLLRWLHAPVSEAELDWLLTSGHGAVSSEEECGLGQAMLALRRRGMERPEWPLDLFLDMGRGANDPSDSSRSSRRPRVELPRSWNAWKDRVEAAREQLGTVVGKQSPMEWARIASLLLEKMGWPGFRPESSVEFQARNRWETLLENCASLGFDGTLMEWSEFVSAVTEAVSQTIFATESSGARVQVTEPLESAGQLADGIWFLGAHEENWPDRGSPHPLLPIGLQREAGMPHASPQADWTLADEATRRLLESATEVVFSYPRQSGEGELRPSRLIVRRLGPAQAQPVLKIPVEAPPAEWFEDASRVAFAEERLSGGAAALKRQSLCPFQAFATARLGAEDFAAAETGLNARQRGQLLHDVLHRVWGGPARGGISDSSQLSALEDLRAFVQPIVAGVMRENFDSEHGKIVANGDFHRFPARFLDLEAERLTRLVVEWLGYERARLPFHVAGTEIDQEVRVGGIVMKVRLDRVDEIPGGSKLIIDYKSSDVGPAAWRGDRPDDVQLPLYATFAVLDDLEGLVVARIRPANMELCGRVRDAKTTLRADLNDRNGLVTDKLTDEQLTEWRGLIERLAEDFVAGHAEADPKDSAKTCARCHLHAICRIREQPSPIHAESDDDEWSEGDAGIEKEAAQHG